MNKRFHLIGSAYMTNDSTPYLIVSYKQFDELMNNPPEGFEFIAGGRTAEENNNNIFKSWGLEVPRCPRCYEKKEAHDS